MTAYQFSYIDDVNSYWQNPSTLKKNQPVPSAGPTAPVATSIPTTPVSHGPQPGNPVDNIQTVLHFVDVHVLYACVLMTDNGD